MDIVEVVGRWVSDLVWAVDKWVGTCPLHGGVGLEVSPRHQRFTCRGCGADGNAVDFARKMRLKREMDRPDPEVWTLVRGMGDGT